MTRQQAFDAQDAVTAVIALHNHRKTIMNCLGSLLAGTAVPQVLVIDCGSTDGGAEAVECAVWSDDGTETDGCVEQPDGGTDGADCAVQPDGGTDGADCVEQPDGGAEGAGASTTRIRVIRLGVNTGRAHALNTGFHLTTTPYVLTVSPEISVGRHCVEKLLRSMRQLEAERILGVQGTILNAPPYTVCSAGWGMDFSFLPYRIAEREPAPAQIFKQRERKLRKILASDIDTSLYRMNTLREVGLMDERLFGCLEDLDLGIRAARMGFACYHTADALSVRRGTTESTTFERQVMTGNLIYMGYKYNRPAFLEKLTDLRLLALSKTRPGSTEPSAARETDAAAQGKPSIAKEIASVRQSEAGEAAVQRGRMLCFMAEMEQMEREELEMSVTKLPLPEEFCMEVSWSGKTLIYPLWLGERMESLGQMLRRRWQELFMIDDSIG
ncbi:MAG: hypothetical protein Q4F25_05030 [Eubacteriales bacterium]|nr:hypothetical protein [Eubacteriales bacterium]